MHDDIHSGAGAAGSGTLPGVPRGIPRAGPLSPSEEEVYPLLLAGLSNREIAAALGIEEPAANARVHRVCQVYGVTTVRRLLARRIAELEAGRGESPGP